MSAFPSLGITEMDIVQVLLFILAVLSWRMLRWLELIADQLDCNRSRAKHIRKLRKQLHQWHEDKEMGRSPKLSETEKEKLDARLNELYDMDWNYGPARGGQLRALGERLDKLIGILQSVADGPARPKS